MQVVLIAASFCAAHIMLSAWSMVLVVVASCCCCISYRLALMLVLTFASGVLTIVAYSCGVFFLSSGANIPLAQVVAVISCNVRWWCSFMKLQVQILRLHPGNLYCVVVVGGGSCM